MKTIQGGLKADAPRDEIALKTPAQRIMVEAVLRNALTVVPGGAIADEDLVSGTGPDSGC